MARSNPRAGDAPALSRRAFCRRWAAGALLVGAGSLAACSRGSSGSSSREITLYCSADAELAEPIIRDFTARTGVRVDAVFDTEATKTTGLVNRLIGEKDAPRADVWWSSEPFGTIRLARAGVLAPYRSASAEASLSGGWPAAMKESRREGPGDPRWYAFASRLRVIACNTRLLAPAQRPVNLEDLARPELKGRIGLARPAFGTTRGHMAALLLLHGEAWLEGWLKALKDNDLRILDGNAAICRALGNGQIHAGLTDSDDVFSAQRQAWPVDFAPWPDAERASGRSPVLSIPNTVAIVARAGGSSEAGRLVDFLLSGATQEKIAASDSRNIPTDPAVAERVASWAPAAARGATIELDPVADRIEAAMRVCERVLGA